MCYPVVARSGANPDRENVTTLDPGVSIDIPAGTAFQYRCIGPEPLRFLCISMPPWPGDTEATVIDGPWVPTAPDKPGAPPTGT